MSSTHGVTVDLRAGSTGVGGDAQGDTYISIENATGSAIDDVLIGNIFANRLVGRDGDDVISGLGADDALFGGNGNDLLIGGSGADTINGGDGVDLASYLSSSLGVTVDLRAGFVSSGGDAQGDQLTGIENVTGSNADDTLYGNIFANRLIGRDGNDSLLGFGGNDTLYGGNGNDELFGGSGNDYLQAGSGNDALFGEVGNDHLLGWYGDDALFGGAGDDLVDGGAGNDYVEGNAGNDTLIGRGGDDVLVGGAGNDYFIAGVGNDGIFMGEGADTLLMTQTFTAGGIQYGNGHDTIFDFEVGVDTILFEAGGMTLADVLAGLVDTAAGYLIEYSWTVNGVTTSQSLLLEGVHGDELDVSRDFDFG